MIVDINCWSLIRNLELSYFCIDEIIRESRNESCRACRPLTPIKLVECVYYLLTQSPKCKQTAHYCYDMIEINLASVLLFSGDLQLAVGVISSSISSSSGAVSFGSWLYGISKFWVGRCRYCLLGLAIGSAAVLTQP